MRYTKMNPKQSDSIVILNQTGNELFKRGLINEASIYYRQAFRCLTGFSSQIGVTTLKLQQSPLKMLRTQARPLTVKYYVSDIEDFDSWYQIGAMSVMFNIALVYFVTNKLTEAKALLELVLRAAAIQIPDLHDNTKFSEFLEEIILMNDSEQFSLVVVFSLHLLGQIVCIKSSQLRLYNNGTDEGIRILILAIKLGRSVLTQYHPVIGWICSTLGHALIQAHQFEEAMLTFEHAWSIAARLEVNFEEENDSTAPAA